MVPRAIQNSEIADVLDRIAALLEVQDANPHRVRAYRGAARSVRAWPRALAEVVACEDAGEDAAALEALPGIGRHIAALVRELVHAGRCALLDRLEGQVSPEDLFCTLPGIGEQLAHRIHATLGIETLEALEVAALDGRLEEVPGIGRRRAEGIRAAAAAVLARSGRRRARERHLLEREGGAGGSPAERPPVSTLLAVDAAYRSGADAGTLRRIAPRRLNPRREAWLPILHVERGGWHFTALFSNTARAHALNKTRDWVVLFYERDGHEDQCTVVTERRGPRAGQRVVRGREAECVRSAPVEGVPAPAPARPEGTHTTREKGAEG